MPSTRRAYLRPISRVAVVLTVLVSGMLTASAAASAPPAPPQALAFPSPLRFVSNLDLECFKTAPFVPSVPFTIVTKHLNPVFADLPAEVTPLGAREQLCVPVAKNNVLPPLGVIDFIKYVDLSCYRTQGAAINRTVTLTHLNPVLSGIPPKTVTVTFPQQLCVPVVKNGAFPPAEVRSLVSYIDLKCYAESPQTSLDKALNLRQLNPVLGHIPAADARVTFNRQLCLPVLKNNQPLPAGVLNIIRWVDLEKYDIVTPALLTPVNLTLTHINPLLANLPVENVTLTGAQQLMLPVAKNGLIPPA
jgi:hypothetical protein